LIQYHGKMYSLISFIFKKKDSIHKLICEDTVEEKVFYNIENLKGYKQ